MTSQNPYFKRDGVTIFVGDSREVMRGFSDQSVHCCVTSPPYWNLRDYGTGTWEGGDELCDHRGRSLTSSKSTLSKWKSGGGQRHKEAAGGMPFQSECRKCGAIRTDQQMGSEPTPAEFVENLVRVLMEVHRVLRDDGTLWLNLGDSYAQDKKWGGTTGGKHAKGLHGTTGIGRNRTNTGLPGKSLVGIPWRVAFALQDAGWILRNEIIWHKTNCMPESVNDRCTRDHEHLFMLSKSQRYYFDQESIKVPASPDSHARYARGRSDSHKNADGGPGNQTIAKSMDHMRKPGVNPKAAMNANGSRQNASFCESVKDVVEFRNLRTVWSIPTAQCKGGHFATFPPALIEPCIKAGCPESGIVLDPFLGSGTTAAVARKLGCKAVGIELNPEYAELAKKRFKQRSLLPV